MPNIIENNMKISNRFLYMILAFSVLINVAAGLCFFSRSDSTILADNDANIVRQDRPELSNVKKKVTPERPNASILHYDSIPPGLRIRITTILNTLVERYGYRSCLEIGQGLRTKNFDWINCRIKISVDPVKRLNAVYQMTSDEFFAINNGTFDLIFIDGLHEAEQVERDIINALEVLNDNGTIVLHDCNPTSKGMQIVPR